MTLDKKNKKKLGEVETSRPQYQIIQGSICDWNDVEENNSSKIEELRHKS